MCKITQIPFLFTACHHLSVVAALEPCVETHVPGRPALYCGPAEWDMTTVAELESHPSRCKNCRSRFNEVPVKKIGSSKTTKRQQVNDLISFSDSSEQPDHIEQAPVAKEQCVEKQSNKGVRKIEQGEDVRAEEEEDVKLVEEEEPEMEEVRLVQEEQQGIGKTQTLEEKAASFGTSVKEYLEIIRERDALRKSWNKKSGSIWQEKPI